MVTAMATLTGDPWVMVTALPLFNVRFVVEELRLTELQLFIRFAAFAEPRPVAKSKGEPPARL